MITETAKTLFFIVIGIWGVVTLWHAMADVRNRAIARHNAKRNAEVSQQTAETIRQIKAHRIWEETLEKIDSLLIHEFVGDLSEGVVMSSYNEDEIRDLWGNEELDTRIAWLKTAHPGDYQRFLGQMGSSVIPDDRYHDALTYLVIKYNGWPVNWSSETEDLDPLTEAEQVIVNAFKSRYPELFEADEEQRSAPAWTPI